MTPDQLTEGQEYVISHSIGDTHSFLEPGHVVILKGKTLDSDGMVFVNAQGEDGAMHPAWVQPEHLLTAEQAAEEFGGDDDESPIIFDPHHPDYSWLPAYDALPLGYALGLVQHIVALGKKPDPIMDFLHGHKGFPTG